MAGGQQPRSADEPITPMQRFHRHLKMAILEAERSGVGVTPAQLARETGVSRASIYAYLRGTTLPPNAVFDRLLDAIRATGVRRRTLVDLRDDAEYSRGAAHRARAAATSSHDEASTVVPRQLPARTAHFVGRRRELDDLTALLDQAQQEGQVVPMVVISGAPGSGKTTLAVYWGHQNGHRFPDGQLYVNLHGFDRTGSPTLPMDALRDFLESLGVQREQMPATLQARAALYRSLLAGRRALVVLDNARDADQIHPLLPASSGSMVLVTSRDPLASLVAQHGAHPITLDVLSVNESTELLASRLGTGRLTTEPAAVAQIIDDCGRLPLALTIVATRAATTTTDSLALLSAQLQDEQTRLQALDAGEPSTDIHAVFAWSYRWLADPAACMFRLLGLHPGVDVPPVLRTGDLIRFGLEWEVGNAGTA